MHIWPYISMSIMYNDCMPYLGPLVPRSPWKKRENRAIPPVVLFLKLFAGLNGSPCRKKKSPCRAVGSPQSVAGCMSYKIRAHGPRSAIGHQPCPGGPGRAAGRTAFRVRRAPGLISSCCSCASRTSRDLGFFESFECSLKGEGEGLRSLET